jgi:hypothetical protein
VISIEELQRHPRRPVVASVAGAEARRQIREALGGIGFRETEDYVCAA